MSVGKPRVGEPAARGGELHETEGLRFGHRPAGLAILAAWTIGADRIEAEVRLEGDLRLEYHGVRFVRLCGGLQDLTVVRVGGASSGSNGIIAVRDEVVGPHGATARGVVGDHRHEVRAYLKSLEAHAPLMSPGPRSFTKSLLFRAKYAVSKGFSRAIPGSLRPANTSAYTPGNGGSTRRAGDDARKAKRGPPPRDRCTHGALRRRGKTRAHDGCRRRFRHARLATEWFGTCRFAHFWIWALAGHRDRGVPHQCVGRCAALDRFRNRNWQYARSPARSVFATQDTRVQQFARSAAARVRPHRLCRLDR